jgi:hypothetical protein
MERLLLAPTRRFCQVGIPADSVSLIVLDAPP